MRQRKCNKKDNLSIYYQNIQCITNKISEIIVFLEETKMCFDVLAFTEHWLKNNEKNFAKISNFCMASCFVRQSSIHGGSCIYVEKNVQFKELVELQQKSIELVIECSAVEITLSKTKIINIYRPPAGDFDSFINTLEEILICVTKSNDYVTILCGDFNLNLQNKDDNRVKLFLDLLATFDLKPSINEPTRISTTETTIDNIFINIPKYESGTLKNGLSDHFGLEIHFPVSVSKRNIKYQIEHRSIHNDELPLFKNKIRNINWNHIIVNEDPNLSMYKFIKTFRDVMDEIYPKKLSLRNSRERVIWMDDDLRMRSSIKRQMYEEMLRGNISYEIYKQYRITLKNKITEVKKRSHSNYILNSSNKTKATWDLVKQITGKDDDVGFQIGNIGDSVNHRNKKEILNEVNNYYVKIAEEVNGNSEKNLYHVFKNKNTMFLNETTPAEIYNIIHSLKDTAAVGDDEIPTKLLKYCAEEICKPLSEIINMCFSIGIFPDMLKRTIIKPIYKKGNKNEIANYRPIALITIIAKIFEKALLNRIVDFTDKYHIITEMQSAYIKGRSTVRTVYLGMCEILDSISNKEKVVELFLDLSKAFDSVDHVILLEKMEMMGFRGNVLNLLKSYLENRTQCVMAKDSGKHLNSDWKVVKRGVPQGSILGPILFLLYINDLPKVSRHLINLFADDNSVVIRAKSDEQLIMEISTTIDSLSEWYVSNNLKLNIEKTDLLKFSLKKELPLVINYGNQMLTSSEYTRFLGIVIDPQLNWRQHVQYLASKISSYTYALRVITKSINRAAAIASYYAYVDSRIKYGIIFWGNSVEASRIFRLQKTCIRSIFHLKRTDTCSILFKENHILTVPCLYILECACFVKKNYDELIARYEPEHLYSTRDQTNSILRLPQTSYSQVQKNVVTQLIKLYNHLPSDYKDLPFKPFKNKIQNVLISETFYSVSDFFNYQF